MSPLAYVALIVPAVALLAFCFIGWNWGNEPKLKAAKESRRGAIFRESMAVSRNRFEEAAEAAAFASLTILENEDSGRRPAQGVAFTPGWIFAGALAVTAVVVATVAAAVSTQ